jgi:DNA polymerase-3 subunit epsilon
VRTVLQDRLHYVRFEADAGRSVLELPLASAEFLAVDTETNGLPGERCELTEVGAVLVGGGELHDSWESLVGVDAPLSRGIQRLTGISQAMIDTAPPAAAVLPELAARLQGRVLVAHSASFDRRVLEQAFERAGLEWPDPPVLCTVQLARRFAPLQRKRGLASLAAALGIEVGAVHRALPDAQTCARVFCALFGRLCANASTVGDAVVLLRGRRRQKRIRGADFVGGMWVGDDPTGAGYGGATRRGDPAGWAEFAGGEASAPDFAGAGAGRDVADGAARDSAGDRPKRRGRARRGARPHLSALPHDPGVYIFRDADGRPLYVGKSIDLRTRAAAHFSAGASWTSEAEHVDHQATESELGALLLEDRLIKALRPPGNVRGKAEPDGFVYLRCRLDIAFPILEVAREPAAGHAVCVGPLRGRAAAAELVEQLNSLFSLRHCGRSLPRRANPSAYGQMGRCLSPCLQDLDPNLYRERLDSALALFTGEGDGGAALLARVDTQIREASAELRYERAAWLQRRRRRLESLLIKLGGVLRAIHASTRLVLAPHPSDPVRFDAVWIAGGRVVDWGPLVPSRELASRSRRAVEAARGGWLPADAIPEARLVGAWIAAHDPPALELGVGVGEAEHAAFLGRLGARRKANA